MKRYTPETAVEMGGDGLEHEYEPPMVESSDGEWVKFEDHQAVVKSLMNRLVVQAETIRNLQQRVSVESLK